ncbi:MAG: hypothetical protein COB98_06015 [Flavobacteriaceae bacterium]|nr:MAG: hypothetical protein COB98_06015 [Flavobacteriaceae bacterium]
MSGDSLKIQTPLRFNKELLSLIKEKAKAEKRSLNNYIEYLLYKDVGNIPNNETIEAIKEARSNKNLEPIADLTSWLEEI